MMWNKMRIIRFSEICGPSVAKLSYHLRSFRRIRFYSILICPTTKYLMMDSLIMKMCFDYDTRFLRWALSKSSFYIAQYPVLSTIQSALHITSLTDLFTQTPSRLHWEASSHMLQLMREGCSCTYPPLSIVRYSFKQLSELEQCRVKKLAQGFNTAVRIRTRVIVVESPKLYPWTTLTFYRFL